MWMPLDKQSAKTTLQTKHYLLKALNCLVTAWETWEKDMSLQNSLYPNLFNGYFWENKIHRCPGHETWLLPAVTYTLHGIAREPEQEFLHNCLFTHFTNSRGMSASDMFPQKFYLTITVIQVITRIFICNIEMWFEIVFFLSYRIWSTSVFMQLMLPARTCE